MMRPGVLIVAMAACGNDPQPSAAPQPPAAPTPAPAQLDARPELVAERAKMVDQTIAARGVTDPSVLAAMRRVPRHEFVPEAQRAHAYDDSAIAIGFDQTISQPYIVAVMTEAAHVSPGKRVLEIGTGSGYQTAVLAELGADVYSIEIVEPLAKRSHALLARLGYAKLHLRIGDGYRGWPEAAPFDAIIVTAAPGKVPQPLIDQLAVGGRLVIPVGDKDQSLKVIERGPHGTTSETLFDVRFVPMTGESARDRRGSSSK
ncbi:MAG: protein-L-isoaspartate O-methyltransferase [Deltaproteobacteria bacterium]|nr:protein-L-isoaspartate O-methyltransferase [Deltaproteobacteria bacterium]